MPVAIAELMTYFKAASFAGYLFQKPTNRQQETAKVSSATNIETKSFELTKHIDANAEIKSRE